MEVKGKDGTPLYGEKEEKVEEMDPEVRARMRKGVVMEILTSEEVRFWVEGKGLLFICFWLLLLSLFVSNYCYYYSLI